MLLLAVNICRFCTLPHNNRSFLASPEQRASYSNHHGEIQTQHCHFWNRKALGWGMFTSFWLCSKCTIRLKCRMQNNFHSSSWSLSVGMFTLKIWLHRYWTSWSSWFGKLYEGRSCELVQVVLWTSPGCRVFREHLVFIFTFLINWKPGLFSYGNLINIFSKGQLD